VETISNVLEEVVMDRVEFDWDRHIPQMMDIASRQLATHGPISGLHPGDVPHGIQNQMRHHEATEIARVWVNGDAVVAFAVMWPQWQSFHFGADPDLGDEHYLRVVEEVLDLATENGRVETEVSPGDRRFAETVGALGLVKTSEPFILTSQDLDATKPIEVEGYTIRGAKMEEVDSIRAAHVSAFGSSWTTETYRRYMEAPPYEPANEIVAVAPDGEIAGFAVVWFDQRNRIGYFEPVGTHSDHQRRGVGSAVLNGGMNWMLENGMARATVMHDADSPNNAAFYRSCGFMPIGSIERWVRE
jgi:ribosomal protein S18 acetylase RimI-like enzyme